MASNRRLAAIMFTDTVGSTAAAQADESRALSRLREQETLLRPLFSRYGGREVKSTGDGFLVEFDSALRAAECAIEIQSQLQHRNAQLGTDPISLRIGVHLGDIEQRGTDIFGDAVNVASRIERLADPSGICISGPVFEQVRSRIPRRFELLEVPPMKGLELPVPVYAVRFAGEEVPSLRATPLVGRAQEQALMHRLLDDAHAGKGGAVLVTGEAGIGKDRLLEEARAYAVQAGFRVLTGRCIGSEVGGAYHPWVEILRTQVQESGPATLHRICGLQAPEVAKLVPEIAEKIPVAAQVPKGTPEEQRLKLYDGLAQFLHNLALEKPVVIGLRDLNGADPASLDFFGYLGQRISREPVLLCGTYRDNEVEEDSSLARLLVELSRERLARTIPLRRLGLDDVGRMIVASFGALPDGELSQLRDIIFERTRGNPFFVEEVLRSLTEDETLTRAGSGWSLKPIRDISIPSNVRTVLRRRLDRLSPQSLALLRIGAVLGMEFQTGILAKVAELDEEHLIEPLEQALRTRLIREQPFGPGRIAYAFTDSQVREVLYDDISLLRRRRYHRRAAEVLESLPRGETEEAAAELAYHHFRGEQFDKALRYSVRASERAIRLNAHEDAVRLLRLANDLLEAHPDDALRGEVLRRLGEQLEYLGQVDAAVRAWQEAATKFDEIGKSREAADLYRRLAPYYRTYYRDPEVALALLDQARKALEGGPEDADLARFYLTVADFHEWAGRSEEAMGFAARAQSIAEKVGDHELEVESYLLRTGLLPVSAKTQVFELLDRALGVATKYDLRDHRVEALAALSAASILVRGDGAAALSWASKAVEAARQNNNLGREKSLLVIRGLAAVRIGDFQNAREWMEELLEFSRQHYPHPLPGQICTLAEVSLLLGDFVRAEEVLNIWLSVRSESVSVRCQIRTNNVLGRWYMERNDLSNAEKSLVKAADLFRSSGRAAMHAALNAETLALLVAVRLKSSNPSGAKDPLAELEVLVNELREDVGFGYAWAARALWNAHLNEEESTLAAFEQSIAAWSRIGWKFELARTLYDEGAYLSTHEDSAPAAASLKRARDLFAEMGAKPDLERTLSLTGPS